MISLASCQLHTSASSFNRISGLTVPFVIGQTDYFTFTNLVTLGFH